MIFEEKINTGKRDTQKNSGRGRKGDMSIVSVFEEERGGPRAGTGLSEGAASEKLWKENGAFYRRFACHFLTPFVYL